MTIFIYSSYFVSVFHLNDFPVYLRKIGDKEEEAFEERVNPEYIRSFLNSVLEKSNFFRHL